MLKNIDILHQISLDTPWDPRRRLILFNVRNIAYSRQMQAIAKQCECSPNGPDAEPRSPWQVPRPYPTIVEIF